MTSVPVSGSNPTESVISVEETSLHDPQRAPLQPHDCKPRAHSHMVELVLAELDDDADAPTQRTAAENAPTERIGYPATKEPGALPPTGLGEELVAEKPAGFLIAAGVESVEVGDDSPARGRNGQPLRGRGGERRGCECDGGDYGRGEQCVSVHRPSVVW